MPPRQRRDPDLPPNAATALGVLGVTTLLVVHVVAWFVLMWARPSGGFHRTTAWTFVFFVPEALLVIGAFAAALRPAPSGRLFGAAFVASVASLALVIGLYAAEAERSWSLPVVAPFGPGLPDNGVGG
jgi:hypothetical protein